MSQVQMAAGRQANLTRDTTTTRRIIADGQQHQQQRASGQVAEAGVASEMGDDEAEAVAVKQQGNQVTGGGGGGGASEGVELNAVALVSQRDSINGHLEAAELKLNRTSSSAVATTTTTTTTPPSKMTVMTTNAKRKKETSWRPFFNPSDTFCHWWSGVVSLAFLYNFWSLSYRFAFKEIDHSTVTIWFMFDYTADIIYLNDIYVNFRTGYLEDGVLQRDPKKIGIHYRESTLFYLDMLCLLPFDFLYLSFSYCSILRCNKLVKIYKFWAFVDRTERHTNYPNVFRTFTLVHYILVIFHWNACLFHMISKHNVIDIATLYKINDNQCDDILCQYLHAFYWSTLALALIGDLPRPRTRGEYIYVIVELCFGLFLFASVLGHVANIVTNVSAARKEFQAKLDAVKTFMRTRRVSDDLQNKVIRWFDYLWYSQKSSDEERSVACLPDRLKAELAIHVNLDTLKRVDIFQNTEAGFLCELVLRLKPVLFSPGDYVCRKNEVGHEMYIVSRGLLEVVTDDGQTVVATFRAGSYFGEIAVLNVGSAGNKRTASVRSVGYSGLFCLSKSDLWDVLKDYPQAEARIRSVAEERLSKLTSGGGGGGGGSANGTAPANGRSGGGGGTALLKKQQQQGRTRSSGSCGPNANRCRRSWSTNTSGGLRLQRAGKHIGPAAANGLVAAAALHDDLRSPTRTLSPALVGHRRRVCSSSSCYYKNLQQQQQAALLAAGAAAAHHHHHNKRQHRTHLDLQAAQCFNQLEATDFCCSTCPCASDLQPDIWLAPATPRPGSSSSRGRAHGGDNLVVEGHFDEHNLLAEPSQQAGRRQLSRYSTSASNFQTHVYGDHDHDHDDDADDADDAIEDDEEQVRDQQLAVASIHHHHRRHHHNHHSQRPQHHQSLANSRSFNYYDDEVMLRHRQQRMLQLQQHNHQHHPMMPLNDERQRLQAHHIDSPFELSLRSTRNRGRQRSVTSGQSHGVSSGGASGSSPSSTLSGTVDGGTSKSTNQSAPAGAGAGGGRVCNANQLLAREYRAHAAAQTQHHAHREVGNLMPTEVIEGSNSVPSDGRLYRRSSSLTQVGLVGELELNELNELNELYSKPIGSGGGGGVPLPRERLPTDRTVTNLQQVGRPTVSQQGLMSQVENVRRDQTSLPASTSSQQPPPSSWQTHSTSNNSLDFEPIEPRVSGQQQQQTGGSETKANECRINMEQK